MFTEPQYRGKGIAKELLSRVVNKAREYGCGVIQITASDMGLNCIQISDLYIMVISCNMSFLKRYFIIHGNFYTKYDDSP